MSVAYLLEQICRMLSENNLGVVGTEYIQKLVANERASQKYKIEIISAYTWGMLNVHAVPQEAKELIVQIREQLDLQPTCLQ